MINKPGYLDLKLYAGLWYEIYRLPLRAERNLVNVTATYSLRHDGKIDVFNQGYKYKVDGKRKFARALAWRPDEKNSFELKVRFFGLFNSSYIVKALDEYYNWAIVSTRNKKYAWILSRTPHLNDELEKDLLSVAESLNIDTANFHKTLQKWNKSK
jgi:lipocalin